MKDVKKEIADLKARIQELENQIAEPKKWSPVGGDYYVNSDGDIHNDSAICRSTREFGAERPSKKQAEQASIEMRKFNRLLALRDELCGIDIIEQDTTAQKYVVYFNAFDMQWLVTFYHINFVTPFFTTEKHAQRACDMLNSGEVEL
jgi:hypothetical protein